MKSNKRYQDVFLSLTFLICVSALGLLYLQLDVINSAQATAVLYGFVSAGLCLLAASRRRYVISVPLASLCVVLPYAYRFAFYGVWIYGWLAPSVAALAIVGVFGVGTKLFRATADAPLWSRARVVRWGVFFGLVSLCAVGLPLLLGEPLRSCTVLASGVPTPLVYTTADGNRILLPANKEPSATELWVRDSGQFDLKVSSRLHGKVAGAHFAEDRVLVVSVADRESERASIEFTEFFESGEVARHLATVPRYVSPSSWLNGISPDGRLLAMNDGSFLDIQNPESPRIVPLKKHPATCFLAWSDDGQSVLYHDTHQNLAVRVHPSSGDFVAHELRHVPRDPLSMSLTPDAETVVYPVGNGERLIFERLDTGDVREMMLPAYAPLRFSTRPVWIDADTFFYCCEHHLLWRVDGDAEPVLISQPFCPVFWTAYAPDSGELFWTACDGEREFLHVKRIR